MPRLALLHFGHHPLTDHPDPLLADAGHKLTDTGALALAWLAAHLSQPPARALRIGGHHRTQVLAAIANSLALIGVVAWILWEVSQRLAAPREIAAGTMLGIALLGLLANRASRSLLSGRPAAANPDEAA